MTRERQGTRAVRVETAIAIALMMPFRILIAIAAVCVVLGVTLAQRSALAQSERPPYEARIPAFVGPTGLLDIPTTAVQRDQRGTVFVLQTSNHTLGGAIVGIANRLEVGVSGRSAIDGRSSITGSAKAVVFPETLITPGLAVGVVDPTRAGPDGTSGYAVLGKTIIPYFVDALAGQRHLAVSIDTGYGGGLYGRAPFGGVELVGDGGLGAVAEIVRGRPNLGLRYTAGNVSATIGWMDVRRVEGSLSWSLGRW